jgi:ribosomal protein S18 acetylase RimI-like enzyme
MIRQITKSDRNTFLIFAKAFYSSSAVAHTIPQSHHLKTFEQLMESDTYAQCYMIEQLGKPVGYALTAKTFSQEAGGMVVWIEELFILPQYRDKGLATEFFTFLKQNVEPHVARLRLEVSPDNADALRLYERLGFEELPYKQMVKEIKK